MGKEDEILSGVTVPSEERTVDPDDPFYWDEPTLHANVAQKLGLRDKIYRGDPTSLHLVLDENQQGVVVNQVVRYWMPRDIDAVELLAQEDDDAHAREVKAEGSKVKPRLPQHTFTLAIRNQYEDTLNNGESEREALGKVKKLVASRLSTRDLQGLPSIAAIHATKIIETLADFKPRPNNRRQNLYSRYL